MTEEQRELLRKKIEKKETDRKVRDSLQDRLDVGRNEYTYEKSLPERILPFVMVCLGVVIAVSIFVFWKYYVHRENNTGSYAEQPVSEAAQTELNAEQTAIPSWSGVYEESDIDKAVSDLYAEEQANGSIVYYSPRAVIKNSDADYEPVSGYKINENTVSPFECVLVRTGTGRIHMEIRVCWRGKDEIDLKSVTVQSESGAAYTSDVDWNNVVQSKDGDTDVESVSFTPDGGFAAILRAIEEDRSGSYIFTGNTMVSDPVDFTEDQISGITDMVSVMDELEAGKP